ncbi:MAG: MerR family transcriptional regulator [Deltaproteobacteria bacterium]|nr:MerR family transcriptional regulator [Deltaproteobacteria bacterium]
MNEATTDSLPDKIYFKIGEVAEIVGVEPYVLRYWETEFPALKPSKSRSQQRMYRKRDVELLLKIKKLLYEDMYTIAGAKRQLLRGGEKSPIAQMNLQLPERRESDLLKKMEKELGELLIFVESTKA